MDFGVVSFDGFSSLDHDKTVTHDFSPSKVTKLTNDFSPSKNLHPKHSSFVLSDQVQEQNMLSFSAPKLEHKNLQNSAFQHFQHFSPTHCKSNAGYSSNNNEGVNARMCYINGVKWPFTTSQWLELEQQALIYKYIIANQPIPPHLLLPIQRALQSAAFCSFPAGLLSPNSYGWGPFQFGFSNNTDPEPGRCRRTDGKKWRCSRDAVPDQKYCERHINRGRHRSRKPVEAHSGLPLTKPTTVTNTNSSAHRNSNFSSSAASSSVSVNPNYSTESHSGVGIRNTAGGLDFLWPKPQAEPERTQLSISIPTAPADYRSSTSSPTGEKVTLSPLRLSRGIDPVQMGMGMGMGLGVGMCQTKQTDSGWKTCIGGPLGEVLKPTNNNLGSNGKSSLSGLSLLSAEWEVNQQMCSSPKGVFKGTAQGSVSNSSAGNSSRESSYVAPYL